jgi:hypothetical protein
LPADVRRLGDADRVVITSEQVMPTLRALSGWAIEGGHEIADLHVRRPALEDVYLALTEPPT